MARVNESDVQYNNCFPGRPGSIIANLGARGGGGAHSTFNWSGCAAGGLKTGPCLKPLGARKIYPVLIYVTKDVHMHTLF